MTSTDDATTQPSSGWSIAFGSHTYVLGPTSYWLRYPTTVTAPSVGLASFNAEIPVTTVSDFPPGTSMPYSYAVTCSNVSSSRRFSTFTETIAESKKTESIRPESDISTGFSADTYSFAWKW